MKFLKRLYEGKLNKLYMAYVYWGQCRKSRKSARQVRKTLIAREDRSYVDRQVKREIKAYCREAFGTAAYWPWLATYTEIRGEFRRGWMPNEYYLYRVIPRLNPIATSHISLAKTMDYRLFGDICVKPVLVIVDHLLFDSNFNRIGREQAEEIIRNAGGELVVKRDGGSGGHTVSFVQPSSINLKKLLGGRYVIQPLVKQHHSMSEIYPHSVNTLRVYTYIDSKSLVSVKALLLVLGVGGQRVSNASNGGRFLCIGEDGKPISKTYYLSGDLPMTETAHPDTGFPYEKIRVPSIQAAMDMCMGAHYRYPYAGFVGWDCYLDEEGIPKLLEWNAKLPTFRYIEASIGPCFDIEELKTRIS
jgi:hypothetical protein